MPVWPGLEDNTSVTNHAAGHPADRALDALLAGYAAGSLSPPLHVLVACHLAISPENRAFVRSLEAANGVALEGMVPVPVPNRDEKLSSIFAEEAVREPIAAEPMHDDVLPAPLVHYLGSTLSDIRWRMLLPGVKE